MTRLILASRSPRRALMLTGAGFAFEQIDPPLADPAEPVADGVPQNDPAGVALRLAVAKLDSVPAETGAGAVVLTADTVGAEASGRLLGTPEDAVQARAMLDRLIGGEHRVATGVALRLPGGSTRRLRDTATVRLGPVPADEVDAYVATGAWRGKACGYNLAERRDAGWPVHVDGDPGTVMGLPMRRLAPLLRCVLHSCS